MNSDQVQGKWKQFSGSFREKFGKFTNDEVAQFNGQKEQLVGKIQERYGDTKQEAERRYDDWANALKDESTARDETTRASGGSRF